MKCPVCQEKGEKSNIKVAFQQKKMIDWDRRYYDCDGNEKYLPDINFYSTVYECECGHRFEKHERLKKQKIYRPYND